MSSRQSQAGSFSSSYNASRADQSQSWDLKAAYAQSHQGVQYQHHPRGAGAHAGVIGDVDRLLPTSESSKSTYSYPRDLKPSDYTSKR